jgi:hypothetical protein
MLPGTTQTIPHLFVAKVMFKSFHRVLSGSQRVCAPSTRSDAVPQHHREVANTGTPTASCRSWRTGVQAGPKTQSCSPT